MKAWSIIAALIVSTLVATSCASGNLSPPSDTGKAAMQSVDEVRKLGAIGVQLYSVREELGADFEGTLGRIAEIGYSQVELAGLHGRTPEEVRSTLDVLGLDAVSMHVSLPELSRKTDQVIADAQTLGVEYVVLPFLPLAYGNNGPERWQNWVDTMNSFGKTASEHGIVFAFHNHDSEFIKVDDVTFYEFLLEKIDRDYVKLELDLYWLAKAGHEVDPYFAEYPGGFHLFHVKDMGADNRQIVDVGDGVIDFADIFARSDVSGVKYYLVEHDNSDDPMRTLERSYEYLRALEF